MKKVVTMIMSLALLLSSFSTGGIKATAAEDYGTTVTELTAGKNTLYVYYPTPNQADTSAVKLTCTAPTYIVFGDGAATKEEGIAYATESGLAKLAADNGSSIIFVQPSGDNWSAEDVNVYTDIASLMSDSSTDVVANGIADSTDFLTGEKSQKITGTTQRIYVYGVGAGADFVANNYLKTLTTTTFWGGVMDSTMASATLEGLSDVSKVTKNDIPLVSIDNSDEINKTLKAANTNGLFLAAANRDFTAQAKHLAGAYRRQDGVLIAIPDYAAEGITEKIESISVDTSKDNTFTKDATNLMNYITYYSKELDVTSSTDKVPLVVTFHGGGNTAKYQAMALEWPEVAKANGFMLVSVDLHYPNHTATEIVELIKVLEAEYPCIDSSRIYATGFSMGSDKTWKLLEQYPQIFAGVAPMHGSFAPAKNASMDVLVPTFFVAGETSPLTELPNDAKDEKTGVVGNDINKRLSYLFKINSISDNYTFDKTVNKWGVAPDLSYSVTDTKTFKNSVLTVNLFQSEDGNYYTALANSSNQSHELFARNAWAAWDFLSQFSRNTDGSITVKSVDYGMSSDDGSVVSNAYNVSAIEKDVDKNLIQNTDNNNDTAKVIKPVSAADNADLPKTGENVLLPVLALLGMGVCLFFMLFYHRTKREI